MAAEKTQFFAAVIVCTCFYLNMFCDIYIHMCFVSVVLQYVYKCHKHCSGLFCVSSLIATAGGKDSFLNLAWKCRQDFI